MTVSGCSRPDATRSAFAVSASKDPVADYVACAECWATDLLAVLAGEVGPTALAFGGMRSWNHLPGVVELELDAYVWRHTHPLARPERFVALYRRLLALESPDVPRIRRAT